MEHFEQLLTCCVCLDRYRNPKLLPCQHSFCMDPCMEGLVDHVRRQVKCPECRAEHRIPYQGVQAFPTNVTLQRFLELRMEITGEPPDPTSGLIPERCGVCSEKAYLSHCAHCDKKICEDCKSAHMDILRREIIRINSQIRRGINRLQDALSIVEKNSLSLQTNCCSVSEEVEEVYQRMSKALKDRAEHLRSEVDRYLSTEVRNLSALKANLDLEVGNIQSNCDMADKYMNDNVDWDDCELMDTKEIFLKTVEFIRSFEYENADYSRRVRFLMEKTPNELVTIAATFGELHMQPHSGSASGGAGGCGGGGSGGSGGGNSLHAPAGPGLMRSKSDHRLASQFRQQQDERGMRDDDEPVLSGRKFGERGAARAAAADRYSGGDRYGRGTAGDYGDYGSHQDYADDSSGRTKSRFRSRFVRSHQNDDTSDNEQGRNVRFSDKDKEKERDRVLDTEDVTRGHLSGIIRLTDSARVMKRLQESEKGKKEKKPAVTPVAPAVVPKRATVATAAVATRQMSEDEIDRIKRQNKGAAASTSSTSSGSANSGSAAAQAAVSAAAGNGGDLDRPAADRVAALKSRNASAVAQSSDESEQSTPSSPVRRAPPVVEPKSATPAPTNVRSASTDSSTSDSSASSSGSAARNGGGASSAKPSTTTPAVRSRAAVAEAAAAAAAATQSSQPEKKPFQSRFLPNHQAASAAAAATAAAAAAAAAKKADTESSSEEETSSEESEEEEEEEVVAPKPAPASTAAARTNGTSAGSRSSVRDSDSGVTRNSRSTADDYSSPSTYGRSSGGYERETSPPKYGRTRASAHNDYEEPRYGSSGYGTPSSLGGSDLARSRSSHALKSRETSPIRSVSERHGASGGGGSASGGGGGAGDADKDGQALSSWARYLKNKYGNRSAKDAREPSSSASSSLTPSASSSAASATARRLSLGLPLRQANEMASSDDDSKNGLGSPTSPTAAAVGITGAAGTSPRAQYLQKRRQLFQLGGRGSEPGCFTWPRGIAVGPDNSIVVADSSNHRVQVFDANGIFVKEFGQYGAGEAEFDCLAGVAVNRIGQYIIADRYNHRIQVLDPNGRFLRAFGSQGTADGKFNYPWGVTTDALGFIYVCDKENHRVQVFQSDGSFVGKFGTCGKADGQLEHPHYIAVSNTNRVIVSDSNNHRVQIFDVNGRVLSTFGAEGSEEGQFKFPRGVAVDDQGFICVADSGNNRIQIFHPDGSFLRAFGSWGSGDAEFKGLEGVAIMSNGNILVCDRENHRVQVF